VTRTEDALPADAPPAELVGHRVGARAGDDDLADEESGNVLFWLRSRVIDSWAALSVPSRPAVTAALAALASTHGVFGSLTHGWSNSRAGTSA
jgi:hypothetical protein